MLTDVSIWLYDLNKCGYFPFRGNAAALFGGPVQTFDALTAWTSGKLLGQTATYETGDGDDDGGAYFLDIHKAKNNDFLVGIWNRLPGNKNNISSVGIGDVVGAASAEITPIDANRIPGFATYFWVMPSENRIACIRVKHDSHGLESFKRYMGGFLRYINPQNVVLGPPTPTGEANVLGYRADILSASVVSAAHPKFSVKSIPLTGDIAYIKANAAAIDKVLSKTTLTSEDPKDFKRWQMALKVNRIFKKPPPLREEVMIKMEIPMSFTRSELEETITTWQKHGNAEVGSGQEDLGFHMRGGKVVWLSKSQPRTAYQIAVSWVDDELVDVESLLSQLQVHRKAVIALG